MSEVYGEAHRRNFTLLAGPVAARGRRVGVPELQVLAVGEPPEAPLPPLRPHLLLGLRHQDRRQRAHRQAGQGTMPIRRLH